MAKTYTIQSVKNLRSGDVVKITGTRVASVARQDDGLYAVTFTNGRTGVFYGDQRYGIYR